MAKTNNQAAAKGKKPDLHYAKTLLAESRNRRLHMGHLSHQVAFSWWLFECAGKARRAYVAELAKWQTAGQIALF
jgi:hypothetical protein